MTDPFVPTGRELDEGVTGPGLKRESGARQGWLRRIIDRTVKHTGKNLTEIEVVVPEAIATKPLHMRKRSERAPEAATAMPSMPENTKASKAAAAAPAKPVRKASAAPPAKPVRKAPATKKRTTSSAVSSFVPSSEFVAGIVTLSRSPRDVSSTICATYLDSGAAARDEIELLTWWMQCDNPRLPVTPEAVEVLLPDEALMVIDEIRTHSTRTSLAAYQDLCDVWDRYDMAVRDLTRKTRSFPSLKLLVAAVKKGDLEATKRLIDYDSAAWHECNQAISEAVDALDATRRTDPRPVMVTLPRAANGLPLMHRAIVSTLCVPSSLAALQSMCLEVLEGATIPNAQVEIKSYVSHLLQAVDRDA